MHMLDRSAGERLRTESYASEKAFEERYLKPSKQAYTHFGATPADFAQWRKDRDWPTVYEREKPDYYLPDAKELYECIGCKGDYVRVRETKPMSMLYWCQVLMADGYYAIWNSTTETGHLVKATTMAEVILDRKRVKVEQRDNLLFVIPLEMLLSE